MRFFSKHKHLTISILYNYSVDFYNYAAQNPDFHGRNNFFSLSLQHHEREGQ